MVLHRLMQLGSKKPPQSRHHSSRWPPHREDRLPSRYLINIRLLQEGLDGGIFSETEFRPTPYEFGCTRLKLSLERLSLLQGKLNFSPGGIAFLKAELRKGIVPTMLEEIIKTRLMVKRSMKFYDRIAKSGNSGEKFRAIKRLNESLQKLLHARQLGLKLIANVTYGYTSANFSGRMPCIEVGKYQFNHKTGHILHFK